MNQDALRKILPSLSLLSNFEVEAHETSYGRYGVWMEVRVKNMDDADFKKIRDELEDKGWICDRPTKLFKYKIDEQTSRS